LFIYSPYIDVIQGTGKRFWPTNLGWNLGPEVAVHSEFNGFLAQGNIQDGSRLVFTGVIEKTGGGLILRGAQKEDYPSAAQKGDYSSSAYDWDPDLERLFGDEEYDIAFDNLTTAVGVGSDIYEQGIKNIQEDEISGAKELEDSLSVHRDIPINNDNSEAMESSDSLNTIFPLDLEGLIRIQNITRINSEIRLLQLATTRYGRAIRDLASLQPQHNDVSVSEQVITNKKRGREPTNPEEQIKIYEQLIQTNTERINQLEQELHILVTDPQEQMEMGEDLGGGLKGGDKITINDLVGKLVVVIHDKKLNKYYITDYKDLFNAWFNKMYGNKSKQILSRPEPEKVLAQGIETPGGKDKEWWNQAGNKIRNNELFKNLSKEQQPQMYQTIIGNILKNIKTIPDDNKAISSAIFNSFKKTPITIQTSNIPKMRTGTTVSEISDFKPYEEGLKMVPSERAGGTTRKKINKKTSTKNKKNKKYRKQGNTKKYKHKKSKKTTKRMK
jgi:hypothetical protein